MKYLGERSVTADHTSRALGTRLCFRRKAYRGDYTCFVPRFIMQISFALSPPYSGSSFPSFSNAHTDYSI